MLRTFIPGSWDQVSNSLSSSIRHPTQFSADSLGLISVRHRLIADQVAEGARERRCLKLSTQHSVAVDTPKTGRPVYYHEVVRQPQLKPDWHAGENFDPLNGDYYQSQRVSELPA